MLHSVIIHVNTITLHWLLVKCSGLPCRSTNIYSGKFSSSLLCTSSTECTLNIAITCVKKYSNSTIMLNFDDFSTGEQKRWLLVYNVQLWLEIVKQLYSCIIHVMCIITVYSEFTAQMISIGLRTSVSPTYQGPYAVMKLRFFRNHKRTKQLLPIYHSDFSIPLRSREQVLATVSWGVCWEIQNDTMTLIYYIILEY